MLFSYWPKKLPISYWLNLKTVNFSKTLGFLIGSLLLSYWFNLKCKVFENSRFFKKLLFFKKYRFFKNYRFLKTLQGNPKKCIQDFCVKNDRSSLHVSRINLDQKTDSL